MDPRPRRTREYRLHERKSAGDRHQVVAVALDCPGLEKLAVAEHPEPVALRLATQLPRNATTAGSQQAGVQKA